jgi:plastocyanin
MSNQTLFYICGIAAAVSAVAVAFIGLKVRDFPGRALPIVVLWFAVLIGGATTFAVLNAKDEDAAKAAEFEQAGKEIEREETSGPYESKGAQGGEAAEGSAREEEPVGGTEGEGATLQLAANPSALAFDQTELSAKPGKVTIDFTNPAAIEHDVAIEKDGKQIVVSEIITEGKTSVSAQLDPGTYTFLCTVPGHAEAGMEGTLTVK